ncbi:MAG TPA: nuclease-related domain-containing protein, partial [Acidimicrobiales bacterium]|nr:nuclease-related domain-containing protein [Acidimicrobiales bacterium]
VHDRAVPGSRSNIDHLVVGRSGVFVIDTKAYRADIGLSGRWGEETLRCSGRDRSDLLRAAESQARTVRAVLADAGWYGGDLVVPVLCFVGSGWLVRPPVTVREVLICSPETLGRVVSGRGPLPRHEVAALARLLDEALPPRLISRR